jgi:TonB family protein
MSFHAKLWFPLLTVSVLALTCSGQAAADRCDFSIYHPFVYDHALLNADLTKAEPKYPAAARAVKASGNVNVRILVNRAGRVVKACALDGHPLLKSASEKAALKWIFKRDFGWTNPPRKKYIQGSITFVYKLDN